MTKWRCFMSLNLIDLNDSLQATSWHFRGDLPRSHRQVPAADPEVAVRQKWAKLYPERFSVVFWRCFLTPMWWWVLTKRFFQLSGIEASEIIFTPFCMRFPGLHGLQPQLSLAQTLPLEFLGARASHFLSECRISRCTSWRVVTDLPWSNKHTVPCLMLLRMIADYLWQMKVYRNTIHSDCLGYSKRKLPCFRNCEPIFIRHAEYSSQLCWILEGVCSSNPQSIIWAYWRTQIPCCACFKS